MRLEKSEPAGLVPIMLSKRRGPVDWNSYKLEAALATINTFTAMHYNSYPLGSRRVRLGIGVSYARVPHEIGYAVGCGEVADCGFRSRTQTRATPFSGIAQIGSPAFD